VRLKELSLKGYLGCDFDMGMTLSALKQLNVLIGPNNSGKSIPFRFMYMFAELMSKMSFSMPYYTNQNSQYLTQRSWHQEDIQNWLIGTIRVTLSEGDLRNYQKSGTQEKWCQLDSDLPNEKDVELEFRAAWRGGSAHVYLNPLIQLGLQNQRRFWTFASAAEEPIHEVDSVGVVVSGRHNTPRYSDGPLNTHQLYQRMRFFSPERPTVTSIKDSSTANPSQNVIDGTMAILKLRRLKKSGTKADLDLMTSVFSTVNGILSTSSLSILSQIDVEERDEGHTISFSGFGGERIDLPYAGTGIAAIFALVAEIMLESESKIFFLEEPEMHLHPGLLSRLILFLRSCKQHQFIISSHSNAILDCLREEDNVFRVSRSASGNSFAQVCKEFTEMHTVLDTLGVRATSLLQSNTVVWVEGPSDIVYLRFLLTAFSKSLKGGPLIENSDYSFCMYGGTNLKVLCADELDPSNKDFVSILRICRRAVLIADSDTTKLDNVPVVVLAECDAEVIEDDCSEDMPDVEEDNRILKRVVQRIKREFDADTAHRIFCSTDGREIENDFLTLSKDVFVNVAKAEFPRRLKDLCSKKLVVNNDRRLPAYLVYAVDGDFEKSKSFQRSFNNKKFKFATSLVKALESLDDSELKAPSYIGDLIEFIERGRDPES